MGVKAFPVFLLTTILVLGAGGWYIYGSFGEKTYEIQVMDAEGNPLANTLVYADGEPFYTDGEGKITLKGVELPVKVEVPGYSPTFWDADLGGKILLEPKRRSVSVSVIDSKTGKKISPVRITVTGSESKTFSENPANFEISAVDAEGAIKADNDGCVTVEAISSTHKKASERVCIDDENTDITLKLTPNASAVGKGDIKVVLKPGNVDILVKLTTKNGTLVGTKVNDATTGDGTVVFKDVTYGDYEITAMPYVNNEPYDDPGNVKEVKHNKKTTVVNIDVKIPGYGEETGEIDEEKADEETRSIKIVVKDSETNEPISKAKIYLLEEGDESRYLGKTSSKGEITLKFSKDDTPSILVKKNGYYEANFVADIDTNEFEVFLDPLPATGNLKITVLQPMGEEYLVPVPEIEYTVYLSNGEILHGVTSNSGVGYEEDLPTGEARVVVADEERDVNIAEDETTNVEFILSSTAYVSVSVVAEKTGAPLFATVEAYDFRGKKLAEAKTGVGGSAEIEVPALMNVKLVVKYGNNNSYETEYMAFPAGPSEITISVPTDYQNRAELVGIENSEGEEVLILEPEKGYTAKVRIVCSGTYSAEVNGSGISPEKSVIAYSCGPGKVIETEIPFTVTAKPKEYVGTAELKIGEEVFTLAVGPELKESDGSSGFYTRLLVLKGKNPAEKPYRIMESYTLLFVFAAEEVSPVPSIDLGEMSQEKEGGSNTIELDGKTVGAYWVVAYMPETEETKVSTDVTFSVSDEYTFSQTLKFLRPGIGLAKMSVEIENDGKFPLYCESFPVIYHVQFEDVPSIAYVTVNGGEDELLEVENGVAEGYVEVPTTGELTLSFHATGHEPVEVQISPKEIEVPGSVEFTFDEEDGETKKKESVDYEYPDWIDGDYEWENASMEVYPYEVNVYADGSAEAVKKNDDWVADVRSAEILQGGEFAYNYDGKEYTCTAKARISVKIVEKTITPGVSEFGVKWPTCDGEEFTATASASVPRNGRIWIETDGSCQVEGELVQERSESGTYTWTLSADEYASPDEEEKCTMKVLIDGETYEIDENTIPNCYCQRFCNAITEENVSIAAPAVYEGDGKIWAIIGVLKLSDGYNPDLCNMELKLEQGNKEIPITIKNKGLEIPAKEIVKGDANIILICNGEERVISKIKNIYDRVKQAYCEFVLEDAKIGTKIGGFENYIARGKVPVARMRTGEEFDCGTTVDVKVCGEEKIGLQTDQDGLYWVSASDVCDKCRGKGEKEINVTVTAGGIPREEKFSIDDHYGDVCKVATAPVVSKEELQKKVVNATEILKKMPVVDYNNGKYALVDTGQFVAGFSVSKDSGAYVIAPREVDAGYCENNICDPSLLWVAIKKAVNEMASSNEKTISAEVVVPKLPDKEDGIRTIYNSGDGRTILLEDGIPEIQQDNDGKYYIDFEGKRMYIPKELADVLQFNKPGIYRLDINITNEDGGYKICANVWTISLKKGISGADIFGSDYKGYYHLLLAPIIVKEVDDTGDYAGDEFLPDDDDFRKYPIIFKYGGVVLASKHIPIPCTEADGCGGVPFKKYAWEVGKIDDKNLQQWANASPGDGQVQRPVWYRARDLQFTENALAGRDSNIYLISLDSDNWGIIYGWTPQDVPITEVLEKESVLEYWCYGEGSGEVAVGDNGRKMLQRVESRNGVRRRSVFL